MSNVTIKYAGHKIVVQITEHAGGGFAWAYTIDGEHAGNCGGLLVRKKLDAEVAAVKVAKVQINCWRQQLANPAPDVAANPVSRQGRQPLVNGPQAIG